MRTAARTFAAVTALTAAVWAAATVATYVAVIRWAATIDDNTLATIHDFPSPSI